MVSHRREFLNWARERKIKVYSKLSDVIENPPKELCKGQKCTFVNDFGVRFPNHEIMGFCERQNNMFTGEDTERYVFLDYDCYWLPAKINNIILE